MTLLPPVNVRVLDTTLDGRVVAIAWDIQDGSTQPTKTTLYSAASGGAQCIVTVLHGDRVAYVPGGTGPYYVHFNTAYENARSTQAVTAPPAEPPPVPTQLDHLKAIFPDATVGDVFGQVTVSPEKTVRPDGSIS